MKKQLWWWLGVVVLTLGLAGQIAIYRAEPISVAHATWRRVDDFNQVLDISSNVVEAEVVRVARGPDTILDMKGSIEPSGQDVIPHMDVTMRVLSSDKGGTKAGQEIVVRQTGGEAPTYPQGPAPGTKGTNNPLRRDVPRGEEKSTDSNARPRSPGAEPARAADPNAPPTANVRIFNLEGDPPYQVGERYLLALEERPGASANAPAEAGVYQVVHPAGRYRMNDDGSLSAVSTDLVAMSVDGQTIETARRAVNGQATIPNMETQTDILRRRIASGGQPGMPTTGGHSHGSSDQSMLLWVVAAVAVLGLGAGLVPRRRRA
jgi:hypothetical protein